MRNSILRDFIEKDALSKYKKGEVEKEISTTHIEDNIYNKLGEIFNKVRSDHEFKGKL